jgi:hypothetical protein
MAESPDCVSKATTYNCVGTTLHRINKLDKAEEAFLLALKADYDEKGNVSSTD